MLQEKIAPHANLSFNFFKGVWLETLHSDLVTESTTIIDDSSKKSMVQIHDLRVEEESLWGIVEYLQGELESKERAVRELQSECNNLQFSLSARESNLISLMTELLWSKEVVAGLRGEVLSLQKTVREQEEEQRSVESVLSSERDRNASLSAQYSELLKEKELMIQECNHSSRKMKEMKADETILLGIIEQLRSSVKILSCDARNKNKKGRIITPLLHNSEKMLQLVDNISYDHVSDEKIANGGLTENAMRTMRDAQHSELWKEKDFMMEETKKSLEQIHDVRAEEGSLLSIVEDLRGEVSKLQSEVLAREGVVMSVTRAKEELQIRTSGELDSLRGEVESKERAVRELQSECNNLQFQLSLSEAKMTSLHSMCGEAISVRADVATVQLIRRELWFKRARECDL